MKISTQSRLTWAGACLGALALLAGCGGGGDSTLSGPVGGSSPANFFITDNLNVGYDAVWVNLHELDLVDSKGTSVKVFESATGLTVNLRSLNDGSSRFLFVGQSQIPAGTYRRVDVTMDKALTLFPTGATTGQAAQFADAFDKSTGLTEAKVNLTTPLTFPSVGTNLVVDFDLASWKVVGNIVTPVVRHHNGKGLEDRLRHENHQFQGVVSHLAGTIPNQTFTLNRGATGLFTVQLNAQTTVFRGNGAGNAVLADGQNVGVRGVFDFATRTLTATSVKIDDGTGNGHDSPEVKGSVKSFDATGGSLVVSAGEIEGFLPNHDTVTVSTSPTTLFFNDRGVSLTKDEFFTRLAAQGTTAVVEAEGGTYDAASNTLTARKLKFEDHFNGDVGNQAEAKGSASNIDATAKTFTMTLQEWEGFQSTAGSTVNVTAAPNAQFMGGNGGHQTPEQFFSALPNAAMVIVHGTFNDGTLTGHRFELRR